MKAIEDAIEQLEADIAELKAQLPLWDANSANGAKQHRGVAKRISLSARRLEQLVRENTFG